ncbi:dephospho-CoA kinase [Daejeonella lutea]|uniref:Dephospho-CoA kinase n=1 Tax=Daejeonella lutea TaxID=572036 RepID=A0A1T5AWM4_9SPHI|nr:dephospho-CoA kinase [Daejeonella lutea]SKB39441.1 dephospho-CoA kinase [Daejeonella lutea]
MLKIGITGGIGSGKTTICRIFEVLGIPVFYADNAAKSVMHSDALLRQDIIKGFGQESYFETGELNRKHISSIVFNDAEQLARLNALVHPAVFRTFDTWVALQSNVPYVLKEAALLFESESYKMCDRSILVKSPEALRIARIIARDNITAEEVRLRMNRQFSDEKKEKLADHIIINDEDLLLIPQVLELHQHFLSLSDDH